MGSTVCVGCYWRDQCNGEVAEKCEDYSPIHDELIKEAELYAVYREMQDRYQMVIRDYDDGNSD